MRSYSTDRIRNVAFVGHSGAGKTSLAEALLVRAGAVPRAGASADGATLLRHEPEEIRRGMSLGLALAPFEWSTADGQQFKVNVIDTPGYADFVGEVESALAVCDLAVFVVSAVDGAEVQTELLWRRASALGVPRMVFVNKDDKDRADFNGVVDQLRHRLGSGFAPLEIPLGESAALHGVVDVLSEEAFEYDRAGAHHSQPLPGELVDDERRLHEALVEEIVTGDDEQLERYLGGEALSVGELERTLAREVLACTEFPVLVGSAATGVGVDRLADFICELGPSPADRPIAIEIGGQQLSFTADAGQQTLAHVFKSIADPFVGQLSVFKVLSGSVRADDHLVNGRSAANERLHNLVVLRGREQIAVDTVGAGDIGAVAKLSATRAGDTLGPKGAARLVAAPAAPPANFAVAVVPRTQADDDKLVSSLERLVADDPTLRVERVAETRQTVLRGIGETHVLVAIERLARKFGVHVDVTDVHVAYRETVTGRAEAVGRVKKQSGGHGQFAVVNLRVAPQPRGDGFAFANAVVGGAIPRNFIPAVEKGVEETMAHGGVHGFPVVDVAVECFDGKFHAVDSSEMAFKAAAAQGFKDAMAAAGVTVLEPISLLRVTAPTEFEGDLMGDITARRGRVQGNEAAEHGEHVVIATVPTSELGRYAIDLRSITGGRGQFQVEHDHYEPLPVHLIERAKATRAPAR